MFHQSSIRSSHNKGSKVKRVVQIALILTVVVWLLNHINKNDHAGGGQMVQVNLDRIEDLNFGRKAKAGSENVVIIDGQKGALDETPEMSEAEDKSEGFDQHTEVKKDDDSFGNEKVESQEVISNTGQTRTQDEQPGSKDGNDDSSASGGDVANHSTNDREGVLQLPSERENENSPDQNERENVEGKSVGQSELITLDEEKNDNGEAVTSEGEGSLRSKDQSEGGEETDEVEKKAMDSRGEIKLETEGIDSHGEDKLETEGNSENSSEVEKTEANNSHGGLESDLEGNGANNLEGSTDKESSDDASLFLPQEENRESNENESSENNIHDSQDVSTDAETTIHGTTEPVSSVTKTKDEAKPNSNEENESMMQTNEEFPKREAVEFQDNSTLKTAENEELPVINEALERDAVESNGDGPSDSGRDGTEEEKIVLQSSEDALESKEDGDEAENSSHDDEENLETSRAEASHVEVAESQGDIIVKEESTANTVLEDTSEPNPKEDTTSELGNDNVPSGATDNAESQGDQKEENTGNTAFEDATELKSKEDTASELGNDNAPSGGNDNIESQGEDFSKEENTVNTIPEDTIELKPKTSQLDTNDAESHGEDFSKEENTANTVSEVTTEPKPEEDTTSELDISLAFSSSGGNDNADSSNEGGKETE